MVRKIRGSGVRHTFPMVGRFAGLWLIVTLAAVAVAVASTYLMLNRTAPARGRPRRSSSRPSSS